VAVAHAALLAATADAACGERSDMARTNPFAHRLHGTVATLLERGVARGEIAPLDLAPLAIDLYLHQRQRCGYSADRILATVRHILFDDLRALRS